LLFPYLCENETNKVMAYTKYKKLEQLRNDFSLNDLQISFLPDEFPIFKVTQHLLDDLNEAKGEALGTEKAKSEQIITPILKELRRHHPLSFKYFSGYEFNVDSDKNLNGYCDFILSLEAQKMEITAPIFCVVEAKDEKIEKGLAQCGAAMYAAQLFNERKGNPKKVIYGCVTNAFSWCFMKLESKTLYIDTNYIPLTFAEPHKVLAVLQWILDVSLANK
jgi:hypothetical protein